MLVEQKFETFPNAVNNVMLGAGAHSRGEEGGNPGTQVLQD